MFLDNVPFVDKSLNKAKGLLGDMKAARNKSISDIGWDDVFVVGGGGGALVGAICGVVAGGIAGALSGFLVIPGLTAWAGSEIATHFITQSGDMAAKIMGLDAIGLLGGIGGFVGGLLINQIPLTGPRPVHTVTYKVNGEELTITDTDRRSGYVRVPLQHASKVQISETDTIARTRLRTIPTGSAALVCAAGGLLSGAFTFAAAGVTIGTVAKLCTDAFQMVSNLRKVKAETPAVEFKSSRKDSAPKP